MVDHSYDNLVVDVEPMGNLLGEPCEMTGGVKDAVNHVAAGLGNLTQWEAIEYVLALHRERQEQAIGFTVPGLDKLRHHCSRIESIYTEWALSTRDREQQDENCIAELPPQVLIARAQESGARKEADRVVDEASEQKKALREEVDQRTQSGMARRAETAAGTVTVSLTRTVGGGVGGSSKAMACPVRAGRVKGG